MPRQTRYRLPGIPQHVVQRGNNRQAVFFDRSDYRRYLECLQEAAEQYGCNVHAYVLMTNHVHLLLTPRERDSISKLLQSIGRKYVQYVNCAYNRTGTLWEGRYKASVIESEGYLLTCYRYVELNPVRAGMVGTPGEYDWSSYRHNAQGKIDSVIAEHEVYRALGANEHERRGAYRAVFSNAMNDVVLKEIRDCANQCRVLGNDLFRAQIEKALSIKAAPRARGRPRKVQNGRGEGRNRV